MKQAASSRSSPCSGLPFRSLAFTAVILHGLVVNDRGSFCGFRATTPSWYPWHHGFPNPFAHNATLMATASLVLSSPSQDRGSPGSFPISPSNLFYAVRTVLVKYADPGGYRPLAEAADQVIVLYGL